MPYTLIKDELRRFAAGELHSGKGGPVVTDRKQALAIALSEDRRKKYGADVRDAVKRRAKKGQSE